MTAATAMSVSEVAAVDEAFVALLKLECPAGSPREQVAAHARLAFRILDTYHRLKPSLNAAVDSRMAVFRKYGVDNGDGTLAVLRTSSLFGEFTAALAATDASVVLSWPEGVAPFAKKDFLDAGVAPPPLILLKLGPLFTNEATDEATED